MAYVEWEQALSVGVKLFDDDHQKLVAYVNDLHSGMVSGFGIADMTHILDGLIDYTVSHFQNEEDLMVKFSYPGYEDHKKEHKALTDKVLDFQAQIKDGRKAFSLEIMAFLKDWLVKHILGTDMKYRDFFAGKGVS